MNCVVVVRPEIVGPLRDALHSVIQQAAEGVANVADWSRCEQCPVWYVERLERLERVFALLEVVGWSDADLREHRWAVLKAVEALALAAQNDLDELDDGIRCGRWRESVKRAEIVGRALTLRDFGTTAIVHVACMDAEEREAQQETMLVRSARAFPRGRRHWR
jgi:hypothetical protein